MFVDDGYFFLHVLYLLAIQELWDNLGRQRRRPVKKTSTRDAIILFWSETVDCDCVTFAVSISVKISVQYSISIGIRYQQSAFSL